MKFRLCSLLCVWVPACVAETPHAQAVQDPQGGLLLFAEVEARNYEQWAPSLRGEAQRRQPARGPHGAFVEVYLDPTIVQTRELAQRRDAWPTRASAVLLGFDAVDSRAATLLHAMVKQPDGWQWVQLLSDDTVLAAGRPSDCLACHGAGADYLFSAQLPTDVE